MASCNPDIIFLGLTLRDLLVAVGWFLTVLSWFVSHSQANRREMRKETRAEIDACIKLTTELVSNARIYYGKSDETSKSQAAEIQFELKRFIARVERLEKKLIKFEVTDVCGELLDAITGDPFESSDRETLSADSDVVIKIQACALALIARLEV
jgi:hypothetical protein